MITNFPKIITIFSMLTACTNVVEEREIPSVPVEPAKARIVVRHPLFPLEVQQFKARYDEHRGDYTEKMSAQNEGYILGIITTQAGGGRVVIGVENGPQDWLQRWPYFKEHKPNVGDRNPVQTPMGMIEYWRVEADGRQCATWSIQWAQSPFTPLPRYGKYAQGYFCAPKEVPLSEKNIADVMNGTGVHGAGVPSA